MVLSLNAATPSSLACRLNLVLRFSVKVAGVVAFKQLFRRLAMHTVDHTPALNCGTTVNSLGPAMSIR